MCCLLVELSDKYRLFVEAADKSLYQGWGIIPIVQQQANLFSRIHYRTLQQREAALLKRRVGREVRPTSTQNSKELRAFRREGESRSPPTRQVRARSIRS